MKITRIAISSVLAALVMVTTINLRTNSDGKDSAIISVKESKAFIRKIGRAFRRVGRAIRRTVRKGTRWVRRAVRRTWNRARNTFRKVGRRIKRVASRSWNRVKSGVKKAARWTRNAARTTWKGVKKASRWVADKAKKAANFVKNVFKMGIEALKREFKKIWNGIRTFDCTKIVGVLTKFANPIQYLTMKLASMLIAKIPRIGKWASRMTGECYSQIQAGFYCAIPDFVKDVWTMIKGSAQYAWKNKWKCLPTAILNPLAPMMPPLLCGFAFWMKAQMEKIIKCFSQISGKKIFQILLEEGIKLGCNIVGGLILDAVLGVFSGGSSVGASLVKWFMKLKSLLGPSALMKVGQKAGMAVDAAFGYVTNTAKSFHACQ